MVLNLLGNGPGARPAPGPAGQRAAGEGGGNQPGLILKHDQA